MQNEDNLENEIKNLRHQGSAESRQRIFAEVRRAVGGSQEQQAAYKQPQIWRNIMKSKMTKYAAAAVIVIGILLLVSVMGGSPDGAGVVWAKVAEKVDQVDTAICKVTVTEGDDESTAVTGTRYYSRKYGHRTDHGNGADKTIIYYSIADNTRIVWSEGSKGCLRWTYPDTEEFEKRVRRGDPRILVKKVMTEFEYKEIGLSEINGITVEGIEFIQPADGDMQGGTGRLWVEVGTDLPVYYEMESVFALGDKTQTVKMVMEDFQWNVEISEDIMPLKLPDDIIYRD